MEKQEELVTAAYSIPAETKERIERMSKEQDLSYSQFVRRIFREYFERVDAETPAPVAA